MLALLESTVRATIRHSDSEANASEAATASISRVEATGAGQPPKPAALVDRIMVTNPSRRGRITCESHCLAAATGNIAAGASLKAAKWGRMNELCPLSLLFYPFVPDIPAIPVHASDVCSKNCGGIRPRRSATDSKGQCFRAKWKPVRVKKTRQNKSLEPRFRFNQNRKGASVLNQKFVAF